MLIRYFKILLVLIFFLFLILFFSNYTRNFNSNLPLKKKIARFYEALIDTRSEILSLYDVRYKNKDSKNIKRIYLDIEPSSLEKSKLNLNNVKNDIENKKEYFSALIRIGEDKIFKRVNFRLRGKNDWHHRLEKPSLRIKFRKSDPYNLMRHINLSSPEGRTAIENFYADLMSKKIGLVGHYGEMVELIINNKSYGLYHLHSREDESMVRINKRMPGPLLLGQTLNEKWNYEDFNVVNLESIKNNKNIFANFIQQINTNINHINWKSMENFWKTANFDKFAKFVAFNNIFQIIHNDYEHNHEFYFDPTIGKVEPIVSDALPLGTFVYPWGKNRIGLDTLLIKDQPDFKISLNQKTNPLLNFILLDPEFYDSRIKYVFKYLDHDLSFKNQSKILNKIYNNIDPIVYGDKFKSFITGRIGGWEAQKYSNIEYEIFKKNVFKFIQERNLFISKKIRENHIILNELKISEFPNKNFLMVKYKGYNSLKLRDDKLPKFINTISPKNGLLQERKTKNIVLYPGLKIAENENQFTNLKFGEDILHTHEYIPDFQTYIIEIDKEKFSKSLTESFFKTSNLDQKPKKIEWSANMTESLKNIKYNSLSLHIWNKKNIPNNEISIGPGNIDVNKNIVVNKFQKLIILPGTILNMYPNVSIFSKGKVILNGDSKKIIIKRKFKDQPWGNISLNGKYSNGSIFKNVLISGGSVSNIENINFSGMISFFWNKNILIEDVEVSNNQLGDDTLHLSNSSGIIKNFKANNCFGDCIDFDYSNFKLENIEVSDSINDGLDFMESEIQANNVLIKNAMDKGISVGENSDLFIENLIIESSRTGIAIKDRSKVKADKININKNFVGIDIYKKNWRYGKEGEIDMKNFSFKENQLDMSTSNLNSLKFEAKDLNIDLK